MFNTNDLKTELHRLQNLKKSINRKIQNSDDPHVKLLNHLPVVEKEITATKIKIDVLELLKG